MYLHIAYASVYLALDPRLYLDIDIYFPALGWLFFTGYNDSSSHQPSSTEEKFYTFQAWEITGV